jgi:hypothetical protein
MVDTNQGQDHEDFAVVENKETCQSLSQQGNIWPRFLSRLALANQKCQDCHAYITMSQQNFQFEKFDSPLGESKNKILT